MRRRIREREKKPTWVKSGTIDCVTSVADEVGSGWDVKFGETKLLSGKTEA